MDMKKANENLSLNEIFDNKKGMFGDIFIKGIKEEDLEDEISLPDQFDSVKENSANAMSELVEQNCLQKRESEKILIKEEMKEEFHEIEEDYISESNNELYCKKESSKTKSPNEALLSDSYQSEIQCLHLHVEKASSHSNFETLLLSESRKIKNLCPAEKKQHDERTSTGEKPFKCSFCPYQALRKREVKYHEITHTGVKLYKCNSCLYQTARIRALKRHEKTHTGERPFKCRSCSYRAMEAWILKAHERIHTGEKPFKCSSCSYQATKFWSVKRHERIHTGERPFKCSSCSYQAAQIGNLINHERTHTSERPFECRYCSYLGTEPESLKTHERTHTGERPFKCTACSYQTARLGSLKRHKQTHIGEK